MNVAPEGDSARFAGVSPWAGAGVSAATNNGWSSSRLLMSVDPTESSWSGTPSRDSPAPEGWRSDARGAPPTRLNARGARRPAPLFHTMPSASARGRAAQRQLRESSGDDALRNMTSRPLLVAMLCAAAITAEFVGGGGTGRPVLTPLGATLPRCSRPAFADAALRAWLEAARKASPAVLRQPRLRLAVCFFTEVSPAVRPISRCRAHHVPGAGPLLAPASGHRQRAVDLDGEGPVHDVPARSAG
jgi:hypothetical protein